MKEQLAPRGRFELVHKRDGVELSREAFDNLVVSEGKDYLLNAGYRDGTKVTTWYIGLFSGSYTPDATLTMANLNAFATEFTGFSQSTRQTWTIVAPSAQVLTNSASKASFSVNATGTVRGAFISSSNTKGGTSGTLMAVARAAEDKAVASGDTLEVQYSITA